MTSIASTLKLLLASLALGAAIACGGGEWGESWGWEGGSGNGGGPNPGPNPIDGIVAPVSPIRLQDPFGTCWAHAALASMESNWMKSNPGAGKDLSEWHLAWFTYNSVNGMPAFTKSNPVYGPDKTFDIGGNSLRAVAIMSRGTGPVDEASARYQHTNNYSLSDLPKGDEARVLGLKDAFLFGSSLAKEDIKSMVKTYGALYTSMYGLFDSPLYNEANKAYRYVQPADKIQTSHAVNIVGWNDNFDKSKFPAGNQPGANGAWIIRMHSGPDWGDKGYFYMSYDTSLPDFASFVPDSPPAGQKIYQYDTLGLLDYPDFASDTAWMSNIFTATGNESIRAVAFYSPGPGTQYEICIRSGVTGTPGTGAQVYGPQTGTLALPGYHQIALTSPVAIGAGKFAVIVKIKDRGGAPVAVAARYQGITDSWSPTPGVGFISEDGNSWEDAAAEYDYGICLKAFTVPR